MIFSTFFLCVSFFLSLSSIIESISQWVKAIYLTIQSFSLYVSHSAQFSSLIHSRGFLKRFKMKHKRKWKKKKTKKIKSVWIPKWVVMVVLFKLKPSSLVKFLMFLRTVYTPFPLFAFLNNSFHKLLYIFNSQLFKGVTMVQQMIYW